MQGLDFHSQDSKPSEATDAHRIRNEFHPNNVDVKELWKTIPHKDTLSYYGVSAGVKKPEAIIFDRLILKCLDKVEPRRRQKPPPKPEKPVLPIFGDAFYLNKELLAAKIRRMPTVQKKIDPHQSLSMLYCPNPCNTDYPLADTPPKIPYQPQFDLKRTVPKPKRIRRHTHSLCDLRCASPHTVCTDYEWRRYKQDPKKSDAAVRAELAEQKQEAQSEPRNYEELYSALITCFQRDRNKDPDRKMMIACCADFLQGLTSEETGKGKAGKGTGKKKKHKTEDDDDEEENEGVDTGGVDDQSGDMGRKGKGKTGGRAGKGGKGGKRGKGDGIDKDGIQDDTSKQKKSEEDAEDRLKLLDDRDRDGLSSSYDTDDKGKSKKSKKKRKLHKGKDAQSEESKSTVKPCPCKICQNLKKDKDSPLVEKMKHETKTRELRDYLKQMRHRQYIKCRGAVYPAPQHKCDPIVCDTFLINPNLGKYCECLTAIEELQRLLYRPPSPCNDNHLALSLQKVKNRVLQRFCECV